MVNRIIAYHLAALVLLTNVGLPVFTHVCNGQRKAWSSVLLPARSCCNEKKEIKSSGACHVAVPGNGQSLQPKRCCEDHTQFLKTESDFFNPLSLWAVKTLQQDFVALPLVDVTYGFVSVSQAFSSFQPHPSPMPLHGRSLLIFQQIFRC